MKCPPIPAYRWLLPAILLLFVGAGAYVMQPDMAGFLYDDGMYLMSAQSLLDGHGYRLIGMAGQPLFYKYPPLYPLFLAGLMGFTPAFPVSIFWLKLANVLLSTAALGLLYYHFRQQQKLSAWICLGLLGVLITNWRFLEISSELMSEPLFLVFSLLTIVCATRFLSAGQSQHRWQVPLLVLLSVASVYTRSVGIVLILAVAGWIYKQRNLKTMLTYLAASSALILPWIRWSASRPDTTYAVGDFLIRTFQETYFQSFRMDLRYEYTLPEVIGKGFQEIIGNLSVHFFPWLEQLFLQNNNWLAQLPIPILSVFLAFLLIYRLYHALRNRQFSLVGMYTVLYLLILPFWSFFDFYPRFIVVILPFLFLFIIRAIQDSPYPEKTRHWLLTLLLTLAITSNLMHIAPYLHRPYRNTVTVSPQPDLWPRYTETFDFIRNNTPKDALLYTDVSDESYFYALNTQRKLLDIFVLLPKEKLETKCPSNTGNLLECYRSINTDRALTIREALKRQDVRYLIYNDFGVIKTPKNDRRMIQRMMPIIPILAQRYPQEVKPVFRSRDGWITVYQFNASDSSVKIK